jgi:protein SCO1/2
MRFLYRYAAPLTLLAIAACGGEKRSSDADGYRGRVLPEPRPKVDFILTDTGGDSFHFVQETDGYVTLLFFGYTNCPDVCPVHVANIAAVLKDSPYELRQQFKVVFVTTDPERDTPERIRAWLDNFDSTFIGLRGDEEEVNDIMNQLGLPGSIKEGEGDQYTVGHAASVIAFSKEGPAHVVYPFGTRQADWAHDLPRLAEHGDRD